MYWGTRFMRARGMERCSAPNTASGMAKHKLVRATILSRPRALAMSFLAAHAPIKKRAMPAEHMATAGRERSENMKRMVEGIGLPIGHRVSDSITKIRSAAPTVLMLLSVWRPNPDEAA